LSADCSEYRIIFFFDIEHLKVKSDE